MSANITCESGNVQSELSAAMDVCGKQADELHVIIARLVDHLSIVMKPPGPGVVEEDCHKDGPTQSQATTKIESIGHTISQASNMLNDILGRLDV